MKRLLILLLSLCLVLTGCSASVQEVDDKLHILATTYPVYLFTTALTEGIEGVEVTQLITEEVSCLHDYTLTVNDMKAIEKADIIIMNGVGLEDFMSDALAQSSARVIDCSEGIDLMETCHDHLNHKDHDHAHEQDPHIWLTEGSAVLMMNNIMSGLSAMDTENGETYNKNFSAASAMLSADPSDTSALSCPYLITFHDGFQYFAADNGLTLLKSIEEEEGSEASAAEIKEIVALIEEYDIPAIFTEKNGSDATARAIARETGVSVYQLDMIMSGEGRGIQPYLDAMDSNRNTIVQALGGN